jgi:putative lipase involved disintegration of autophagic bodies
MSEQTQYEMRCILDAINEALHDLGREEFQGREEVEAVIFIAVKDKSLSGLIIGSTSKMKLLDAILSTLVKSKIISVDFGMAVLQAWCELYGEK